VAEGGGKPLPGTTNHHTQIDYLLIMKSLLGKMFLFFYNIKEYEKD